MGFYDEAVHVLETIARALNGAFSYGSMADFYNRSPEKTPICPEFSKTAVRMKKHIMLRVSRRFLLWMTAGMLFM